MSRLTVLSLVTLTLLVSIVFSALPVSAHGIRAQAAAAPSQLGRELAAPDDPNDAGVAFTLVEDNVDAAGKWSQTFKMLVKPGGTLADASTLLYGTPEHAGDIFDILKVQYPNLRGPGQVPAGLEADITVDPTVAFVPKQMVTDATQKVTKYLYYNGARRMIYDQTRVADRRGLSEIVELPADRPAKTFTILEDFVPRSVPAAIRIAYYDFQPTDNLTKVVAEIYGNNSIRAIRDFLTQTAWDPNAWPPGALARHQRIVIPLNSSFEDQQFQPVDVLSSTSPNPSALQQQAATRASAGIYAVQRQPYGTLYHVLASDFNLTARQVSKLLYGSENQYLTIAAAAGFGTPHDLGGSPPQDVRLFSRSFDVQVNYEDEQFPINQSYDAVGHKHSIVLINGTKVDEWDLIAGQNGLLRQVSLPSGYRKMLYRPGTVSSLVGQVLYTMVTLGRTSSNPQVQQEDEGRFVSSFIWNWGRSVPRQSGEVLDYGQVITVPADGDKVEQLLELATRPGSMYGTQDVPFYRTWLNNSFAIGAIAVLMAVMFLGIFGFVARRI